MQLCTACSTARAPPPSPPTLPSHQTPQAQLAPSLHQPLPPCRRTRCSKRSEPKRALKNSALSTKLTSSPSRPCSSYRFLRGRSGASARASDAAGRLVPAVLRQSTRGAAPYAPPAPPPTYCTPLTAAPRCPALGTPPQAPGTWRWPRGPRGSCRGACCARGGGGATKRAAAR